MRADCHIHLDRIGGAHKTQPPSIESLLEYARREEVSLFFTIYEHDETLIRYRIPGIDFVPVYWERKPLEPSIPATAKGVKLHPYIENYPLVKAEVEPVLEEARARDLFLLIHTEDRKPELSRGRLVARLARDYPDVVFIMAHSGSYAPPSQDKPGTSSVPDALVEELVSEAVRTARMLDNVFLETSILVSDIKARILARAPVEKLLIGTDFPILAGTRWTSLRFQEEQLIRHGFKPSAIERIHQNAMSFIER